MEIIVEKFDKLIDKKNKEIENKFLLKVKNTKMIDCNDNVDLSVDKDKQKNIIDYTTKQTINKINAEQDRKYKSSKSYKKLCEYNI